MTTQENSESNKEKYRARFAKWQVLTIEERGKVINLILTLSIATIGFVYNLIKQHPTEKPETDILKLLVIFGMLCLTITAFIAVIATVNRLKGLRLTTKIAKHRKDGEVNLISEAQRKSNECDKCTLCLTNVLFWTFGFGETSILIWFGYEVFIELCK